MLSKSLTSACRLLGAPARHAAANVRSGLNTSAGRCVQYSPVPAPLLKKMKLFQLPNNLPVHIKGGPVDKTLFAITMGICLLGLVECFHVYYVLAFPPPKSG